MLQIKELNAKAIQQDFENVRFSYVYSIYTVCGINLKSKIE